MISLLVFFSLSAMAIEGPRTERLGVRVLTFNGNDPWRAMQTLYVPAGGGRFRTQSLGGAFRFDIHPCGDHLSRFQKRPLDVMLKNRYITRAFYDLLIDPAMRVHDMRQYVLVILSENLTADEAHGREIDKSRLLDPGGGGDGMEVGLHLGSLFAVRGYDVAPSGADGFSLKPLALPWEVGQMPGSLDRPLVRDHLTGAIEIGRALVDGGGRNSLKLMMQVLVNVLAADARVVGLDPAAVPVMAHGMDANHLRLFAHTFRAQLMTPEIQTRLEEDPSATLADLAARPPPGPNDIRDIADGMVLSSLGHLIRQFPVGAISDFAAQMRALYPVLSDEQSVSLIQELPSLLREKFDFMFHDEHRPGHRFPIIVRDLGTGMLGVKMMRALKRRGVADSLLAVDKLMPVLLRRSLEIEPDLAQDESIDKGIIVPIPPYPTTSDDMPPALVISNLDPTVPSSESPAYLGRILLSVVDMIEDRLRQLDSSEREFMLKEMNRIRVRRGLEPLPSVAAIGRTAFLETYDLVFGTQDSGMAAHLKILGATLVQGFIFAGPGGSGPTHIRFSAEDLGLKGPAVDDGESLKRAFAQVLASGQFARFARATFCDLLANCVLPTTVYRFGLEEVVEQEAEHPADAVMGPRRILTSSDHVVKGRRLYITYQ